MKSQGFSASPKSKEKKAKPSAGSNKNNSSRAWTIIQEALTSEDSVVREAAVQSLEFVQNAQAVNSLISSLEDESEYVRIWAARGLARKGHAAGKGTLLEILQKTDDASTINQSGPLAALAKMQALARGRFRGEAAKVLGLLKDPTVVPLLKNAKRDNDGRVRDGASVALALMGDRTETVIFESALKDSDSGVRQAAVEALLAIKDKKSAPALRITLEDPEEIIRSLGVKAMGELKEFEVSASVAGLLQDQSGLVRENASWSLGEIGDKDKTPNLKGALADPNMFVRIASAEALAKMADFSGLPTLELLLNANDVDTRIKSSSALGLVRDPKAQALVVKTMDDGNPRVRLAAATAFFKLSRP